jgi:trehalose/maltose hydrolase-like predicted phosphorylase
MGPDEFHEAYPEAAKPGLNNNAYTNMMAVWVFLRAQDVLDALPDLRRAELIARCEITQQEIALWSDISRRMFVPFHDDGIISQFEGYEKLRELDWQAYRAGSCPPIREHPAQRRVLRLPLNARLHTLPCRTRVGAGTLRS